METLRATGLLGDSLLESSGVLQGSTSCALGTRVVFSCFFVQERKCMGVIVPRSEFSHNTWTRLLNYMYESISQAKMVFSVYFLTDELNQRSDLKIMKNLSEALYKFKLI